MNSLRVGGAAAGGESGPAASGGRRWMERALSVSCFSGRPFRSTEERTDRRPPQVRNVTS